MKKVPRLREHISRCKNGVISKIHINFEINNKENKTILRVFPPLNSFTSRNIIFANINSGEEELYEFTKELMGEGSFGMVYFGINNKLNYSVAIKYFKEEKENIKLFTNEVFFLNEFKNEDFFPKIFYSEYTTKNKLIIQSLLGPNLRDLLDFCGGKLPLYSILSVGIELFKRIKTIHKHGIIHRDIKPSNIAFCNFSTDAIKEKNGLYIIDYGLSTKYIENENNHFKFTKKKKFVGTCKYASRHALNGERHCRRDDIESIFYILIYLFLGNLPWHCIQSEYSTLKRYEKTRDFIINIDETELLNGLPKVLKFIYKNIIFLEFEEEPPYDEFIALLEKEKENIISGQNFDDQYKFIWIEKIIEVINSNEKKNNNRINEIRKIFYNIEIEKLKSYFKVFKKENVPIFNL